MNNKINALEGKKLDDLTIIVKNVSKGRFAEETNFQLYLKNKEGIVSKDSVINGKYFSGREEYKPWVEVYYNNVINFDESRIDLSKKDLDEKLFKILSELLPPGSHIMVAYLNHEETREGLKLGIPAPATPLGFLLWKAGFLWFKDWYFAEGFMEGDIKLQGQKPLIHGERKKALFETDRELKEFINNEKRTKQLFTNAKKRAKELLVLIKRETSIRA